MDNLPLKRPPLYCLLLATSIFAILASLSLFVMVARAAPAHASGVAADWGAETLWAVETVWGIETIVQGGAQEYTGQSPSLVFDSSGRAHLAYRSVYTLDARDTIHYVHMGEEGRLTETVAKVESGLKRHTALALDSQDRPHIVYVTSDSLVYATREDSTWMTQTVPIAHASPSIAIGDDETVHITSMREGTLDGQLEYAVQADDGWDVEIIAADVESGYQGVTALALDGAGHPHIVYGGARTGGGWGSHPMGNLRYSRWNGSEWQARTVFSHPIRENLSLVLAADDTPHLSFITHSGDLHYAVWNGDSWLVEMLHGGNLIGASSAAVALTVDGNPAVAYYAIPEDAIRYGVRRDGAWTYTVVQHPIKTVVGDRAAQISLAFDAMNRPHMAFYDEFYSETLPARSRLLYAIGQEAAGFMFIPMLQASPISE